MPPVNPNTTPSFNEMSSVDVAAEICMQAMRFREHLPSHGVVRTELEEPVSHPLEAFDNATLLVKNETLQPVGSYKLRGATAAILVAKHRSRNERMADPSQPELQFVSCATQGNHGASVAYAARRLGLQRALVKTTFDADPTKLERLRDLGAAVHAFALFEQAQADAIAVAELPGHAYIAPFDSVETMAGQASIGYEILEDLQARHQRGDIDLGQDDVTILAPGGGGGLAAATAAVLYNAKRQGVVQDNVRLIVAQMENCDAIARARYGREPLTKDTIDMSCSSTGVLTPGALTMRILSDSRMVDGIVSLSKSEVAKAMQFLTSYHNILVEPAGALALGGAILLATQGESIRPRTKQKRVFVTVTSGANISYENFAGFHPDTTMPPDSMTAAERQQAIVDLGKSTHIFGHPVYRAVHAATHTKAGGGSSSTNAGVATSRSTRIIGAPTRRSYVSFRQT